ncbi:MAG: hypothetical protein AAF681_07150 [Pseudomonadota bacterium]
MKYAQSVYQSVARRADMVCVEFNIACRFLDELSGQKNGAQDF